MTACVVDTCVNFTASTVYTGAANLHPGAPTIIVHLGKDGTAAGVNDTGGQFAASANGTSSLHLDLLTFLRI